MQKVVALVGSCLLVIGVVVPSSASDKYEVFQRTLATFSGSATNLTSLQKSQVEAAVEANPKAEKFICTGIRYYAQPMSVNIMVRKRAKAACEYAKSLNPELSTWFQTKPTMARSFAGKVLLTIKSQSSSEIAQEALNPESSPSEPNPSTPGVPSVANDGKLKIERLPTIVGAMEVGEEILMDLGLWGPLEYRVHPSTGIFICNKYVAGGVSTSLSSDCSLLANYGVPYKLFEALAGRYLVAVLDVQGPDGSVQRVTNHFPNAISKAKTVARSTPTPTPTPTPTTSSPWSQPVISIAPTPTLSGIFHVGNEVTATPGTWTKGVTLGYEWLRNGRPIPGEKNSKYLIRLDDVYADIQVKVFGYLKDANFVSRVSAPKRIELGVLEPIRSPVLSGEPKVRSTLTLDPGDWGPDADLKVSWIIGSTEISRTPNALTRVVGDYDLGKWYYFVVRASKPGYKVSTITGGFRITSPADFSSSPLPAISGNFESGQTLRAELGSWLPSPSSYRFSWYRDGERIGNAVNSIYQVPSANIFDRNPYEIRLKVCASREGFETTCLFSPIYEVRPSAYEPQPLLLVCDDASKWPFGGGCTAGAEARPGKELLASVPIFTGNWGNARVLTNSAVWFRDGASVSEGRSYLLSDVDVGKQITVLVSAVPIDCPAPYDSCPRYSKESSARYVLD